jgi:tRNA(Ile)-lysidine synthase
VLVERTKLFFDSIYGDTKNQRFVVGVSGGPDSICILDILAKLNYDLIIAHLDHQIREQSCADSEFIRNIAQQYDFPFVINQINVPFEAKKRKTGIEEAARILRYQFLFETAENENATAVITAHQADDQVETVLMNIIRGSGLNGLCGMQNQSYTIHNKHIPLLRPLLTTWRSEVMKYCDENNLEYVVDESNADLKYQRNRVRNSLIVELETYNPKIKKSILRMSGTLSLDQEFLSSYIDQKMSEVGEKISKESYLFKLSEFLAFNKSLQRLAIKSILEEQFQNHLDITRNVIKKAQKFFAGQFQTLSIPIGRKVHLIRDKNQGIITLDPAGLSRLIWPSCIIELKIQQIPETIRLNEFWSLRIREIENPISKNILIKLQNADTALINLDQVKFPLEVRAWHPGERFSPFGMNGKSMKLSDFWINQKIPKIARESWPLVISKGEIIWIAGKQISDNVRITKETERVLQFSLVRV